MKRHYTQPLIVHLSLESESIILDGSDTNVPLKVQNVTVENLTDGFADSSNPGVPGFQDVSFD